MASLAQAALVAVVVAACVVLAVPRLLGWHGVLVLTGSMAPTLEPGGVAFVDEVRPESVRVGDVITFSRPGGSQVTHRVVEVTATVDGPVFRTKGDANEVADPWVVEAKALVGKLRYALPHAGGAVGLLVGHTRLVGGLMALAAAYLVYDEVRRWRRLSEHGDGNHGRDVGHPAPPRVEGNMALATPSDVGMELHQPDAHVDHGVTRHVDGRVRRRPRAGDPHALAEQDQVVRARQRR